MRSNLDAGLWTADSGTEGDPATASPRHALATKRNYINASLMSGRRNVNRKSSLLATSTAVRARRLQDRAQTEKDLSGAW